MKRWVEVQTTMDQEEDDGGEQEAEYGPTTVESRNIAGGPMQAARNIVSVERNKEWYDLVYRDDERFRANA